jgi:hypothetical protein
MMKTLRGLMAAGLIVCALPFSGLAMAQTSYAANDRGGNLLNFAARFFGGLVHPFHIMEGLISGTGNPQPVNVDSSGNVSVNPNCLASSSAPTYSAGVNPLSCDLSGNLRTSGGGGGGGGGGNVNLTGINGVTPLAGAGATGTGSPRVTTAQDATTLAGSAPGTVGSSSSYAVPVQGVAGGVGVGVTGNQSNASTGVTGSANVPVVSYNYVWNGSSWIQWIGAVTAAAGSHVDGWDETQGLTTSSATCASGATIAACQKQTDADIKGSVPAGGATIGATGYDPSVVPVTSASINVSTATTTQIVALSSGKLIYVSGGVVMAGGTGNITFEYGTGTACATGTTVLGGAMPLVANVGFIIPDKTYVVPAGDALCVLTSAAVQYSGTVGYVQK